MPDRLITYFIIFLLSLSFTAEAQRGNNWVSGKFGGLTFNTVPPETFQSGIFGVANPSTNDTNVASFSSVMSDCDGNLLFYSNGHNVWNRDHEIMPNGNLFSGNRLHYNIIVPIPGNNSRYILFYICMNNLSTCKGDKGVYYSVIDLSLDDGMGDIDTADKHQLLINSDFNHGSKMAVLPHANNHDWWLVTYMKEKQFTAFHIDNNGISDTAISNGIKNDLSSTWNYFVPSHDGQTIVSTFINTSLAINEPIAKMYDFNSNTGIVDSNYTTLLYSDPFRKNSVTGTTFSPNDTFIYLSTTPSYAGTHSYIYRLNRYDDNPHLNAEIIASTTYNLGLISGFGGLNLGPDNKIYISRDWENKTHRGAFLDVIHNPNHDDVNQIQHVEKAIAFDEPQAFSFYGLPPINYPVHNIDFSYNSQCRDTAVFRNLSDTTVSGFTWLFRHAEDTVPFDSLDIEDKNVQYTFPDTGTYIVTLTGQVSGDRPGGCPAEISYRDTVKVTAPARAGFHTSAITYQCGEATLYVNDTSRNTEEIYYDYGDSVFTTSPSYTYDSSGTYHIRQAVVSADGCTDTTTREISIFIADVPEAAFTMQNPNGCIPMTPDIENNSTGSVEYRWLVDGNTVDSSHTPGFTVSDSGTYDLSLIAFNTQGCPDTLHKEQAFTAHELNIQPGAQAKEGCAHMPFAFDETSDTTSAWHWDFGDGNTSTEHAPQHVYNEAGTYTPLAIASNIYCADTVEMDPVTIADAPEPSFSLSGKQFCTGNEIQVTNEAQGNSESLFYTTPHHDTTYDENPVFELLEQDTFYIVQHLESSNGCKPKDSQKVIVLDKPVADMTLTDTTYECGSKTMHFSDASRGHERAVWMPDNNSTDTGTAFSYTFEKSSLYDLQLVAQYHYCSDTLNRELEVDIRPGAEAAFHAPDTIACLPGDVTFVNNSTEADRFHWDFGKGSTRIVDNNGSIDHRYEESGRYTIRLVAESKEGCLDTLVRQYYINIIDSVRADFSYAPEAGCQPLQVSFENYSNSGDRELNHTWSFGTGDSSTSAEPVYTYDRINTGTYDVTLTADNEVCGDTVMKQIKVTGFEGNEDAPLMHAATVEDGQTQVTWHREEAADRYHLYRLGEFGYRLDARTEDTTWTDPAADPSSEVHTYRVRASDTCGNTSAASLPARNILLQGDQEANLRATIHWNKYEEWKAGVSEYILQRAPWNGQFSHLHSGTDTMFIDEEYFDEDAPGYCYRIMAHEADGQASSISNVLCLPYEPALFVPNAFSPDDNDINDEFVIRGTGIESFELTIYNRWGQEVYSTRKMDDYWDGRKGNKLMPEGVYLYYISAKSVTGELITRRGTLTLIK